MCLARDLIDSLHTSTEEETQAKTELLAFYAPFKIAQRYLALMFDFTFIASYFTVLVPFFLGRDINPMQAIITAFKLDWIMLTIVGFYFGGGAFEGVFSSRKKASP